MGSRYNSSNIQDIVDKKIFFDANVLIYLFGASTSAVWENQYASLYSSLDNQNNEFLLDYIVISEFVNRAIKIEYKNYLQSNNIDESDFRYKSYRNSQSGKQALEDIYLILKDDILTQFEVVETSHSKDDLILMCIIDSLDFSDKAILKICDDNQFILLTNDKDFKDATIDIISCHRGIS